MNAVPIHERERLDDLLTQDLKIIQSDDVFSFSLDAVLLARFCSLPQRGRIMDLCTGNGVIPLLMTTRTRAHITAVEIQEKLADMAQRNVRLNGLEEQIDIRHGDLRLAVEGVGHGLFDALTVNPPYLPVPNGDQNVNAHFAAARHELFCTLEDVIRISSRLVRTGGKVAMVHRPSRLVEICTLMRQYKLEPKRVRFVHPRADQEANMILIEGMRDGKPELRTLPPLIVYKNKTEYTDELADVYFGRRLTLDHDPDTY
ncbi:tRNA1(Val) A37 N6-methylase TrmN6 [Paenibacillus sp. UNCCL117]|uniref:tRNA1(Val) (adenine(37)-N6)-methyltransferase n=1 Tax=unclassified Paenibacillus TaxID=185978 RepID=UPI00088E316B|nr:MULTISPECIES: tRNA1(Val) (adenine(37)-N6)-methyltransferase [unclassified Paenibacillus]SDE53098.1 tRNA1(Val) A37 N6-methylase TrmN6 [Paenibacillus sp. cl123]SFW67962.1 tRNA1(Val) A37 N6-methylase TrmN6 [Paenibacillus sp. UNCCL117]